MYFTNIGFNLYKRKINNLYSLNLNKSRLSSMICSLNCNMGIDQIWTFIENDYVLVFIWVETHDWVTSSVLSK